MTPLVDRLCRHPKLAHEVVHRAFLAPSSERFGELDPPLPPPLTAALAATGVERLWSHQAAALAAARARRDVLVTTPTASGKSLVFQLPVLEEAMVGGVGRALFLFPLKALGQDQRTKFEALARAAGLSDDPDDPRRADCRIYDGDTPRAERTAIRSRPPRVLVTNPDMLHLGILGHWTSWQPFLADLQWIVLDELHSYRGIFGSHFHHVLQRLLRLARRLGAEPSLVASSATAANAGEFATALTGREPVWVEESGAPREGRHLVLLRPEASPYSTTLDLFVSLLEAGLKTIVFTKARRITELLYSWLRRRDPELARRVASYRSGFLPEERRKIEGDLFSGRLDGVVSTSALEMGIDVGGLDACVLVGYPGSVMATWQRSGRVGRSGRESLTVLVALPDALDQYFLDHPDELVRRPLERLVVDPGNAPIAREHLVCAAAEEPLRPDGDDAAYLAPYLAPRGELVDELLAASRLLEAADGAGLYSLARNPHRNVSLRGTGDTFVIADAGGRRTIGTVDGVRVLHECHPGAVYLHRGRQYLVDELQLDKRRALAERADVDYYTSPLTDKETEILEVLEERREGPLSAWLGRVRVTERVVGYERRRIQSRELLGQHDLDLPPVRFETVALWWAAPRPAQETLRQAGRNFMGALHASEHAAISLFPLLALCDRNDIGGISYPRHPQVGCGAVFVYDGHPGGVGIAAAGFRDLDRLLTGVAAMIDGCACEDGCPSCIQSPKCGNGNRPLDKAGAVHVLRLLLGEAQPAEPWGDPVELDLARRPGWAREAAERRRADEEGQEGREGQEGKEGKDNRSAKEKKRETGGRERSGPAVAANGSAKEIERVAAGGATVPGSVPAAAATVTPPAATVVARADVEAAAKDAEAGDSRDAGTGAAAGGAPVVRPPSPHPAPASRPLAESVDVQIDAIELGRGPHRRRAAAANGHQAPYPPPVGVPGGGTVLFDLETLRGASDVGGWGNAHRMGVAVGVALFLEEGRFAVFHEDGVGELVDALCGAELVVGFNVKRFDYQVLSGYTGVDYCRRLPTLDLLEELHRRLGFRIGLGHLALETLGAGKSADGLQSLRWVREGRLDLVEDYCRHDVEVLRDLYLHGRREGCVFYRDRKRDAKLKVAVEW